MEQNICIKTKQYAGLHGIVGRNKSRSTVSKTYQRGSKVIEHGANKQCRPKRNSGSACLERGNEKRWNE